MRPLDMGRSLHLVLRSQRARGGWSLLHRRNRGQIFVWTHDFALLYGVHVLRFANVGNHLHIVVRSSTRLGFQNYLRRLAGAIAMYVTGARRGQPCGRFWDLLAYTRIVEWGREFATLKTYIAKNILEAEGWNRARLRLQAVGPWIARPG